jgi:hypothetical protein
MPTCEQSRIYKNENSCSFESRRNVNNTLPTYIFNTISSRDDVDVAGGFIFALVFKHSDMLLKDVDYGHECD